MAEAVVAGGRVADVEALVDDDNSAFLAFERLVDALGELFKVEIRLGENISRGERLSGSPRRAAAVIKPARRPIA